MGLSAALYSGTSGLKVHGEGMTVVGNNISNVSTLGYKGSSMYFEDALSQEITTASGIGQVGRGASVSTVMADFSQGSLESTTESTDLAIGGNGFFIVSPAGQEVSYYTRAGNFRFDKEGYLVNPQGYRLQGWEVQEQEPSVAAQGEVATEVASGVQIRGVPQDIKLENFQSPPQSTNRVDMILNLDSRSQDSSTADGNPPDITPFDGSPFTALFEKYNYNENSSDEEPLGDLNYAYQSTIKVYDDNGSAHTMTIYMDPVRDPDVTENSGGNRYWEYVIAVPPNEDNREFWADQDDSSKRGVLMAGTLTFNAAGQLQNMSAFTIKNPYNGEDADGNPIDPSNPTGFAVDASRMENWENADFSENGYPILTANFLGAENGSTTSQDDATFIEINFGIRDRARDWTGVSNLGELKSLITDVKADDADLVFEYASIQDALGSIPGFEDSEPSALATTNYSSGSTTIFQSQDGYTAGFLQNISVDRDGVITGSYSNGQVLQLYAVTLATFNNNFSLYREGGNLFSETRSSGPPITGLANTGGKGSIASNSLEQSNVDLATEFVKMITTEKGFQANSKTITTVDQMLTVLIQLKR